MGNLEMGYIGDPNVINSLVTGDELVTLLLPGGGQGCIYQAGVLKYLEQLGLKKNLEAIYGNSGGTIMGWNLLGDGIEKNVGCLYEEHVEGKFIDPRRGRGLIDTSGLAHRMLSTRSIDFAAFQQSSAQLYAGTTNASGEHTFFRVPKTTLEQAIPFVFASFAIPGIGKLRVWIDGERQTDGAFSDPLPAESVSQKSKNLLVISTKPFGRVGQLPEWFVNQFSGYPHAVLNHTRMYNQGINFLTEKTQQPNSRTGIIFPYQLIPPGCMDSEFLKEGEEVSYQFMAQLAQRR